MTVWDTFLFRNEFDILKIRLMELWDVVDKFVLIESTRTFRGQERPLQFLPNRGRFAAWADKIEVVTVDDLPTSGNAWVREHFQRNCIARGLSDVAPDDVVLISDVDELPDRELVAALPGALAHGQIMALQQQMFYYSLNWRLATGWHGTRAVRGSVLESLTPQQIRSTGTHSVNGAGWHFSYLAARDMVVDELMDKVSSFSHDEYDNDTFMDRAYLTACVEQGLRWCDDGAFSTPMEFVEIGPGHPAVVRRHLTEFTHLLSDAPDPHAVAPRARTLSSPHAWSPDSAVPAAV